MTTDYYKEEARKELERRLHSDTMLIKAWQQIKRNKTKEGKDFKALALNFNRGAILPNPYTPKEKVIHAYIEDDNYHYFRDEMSLSKTIYSGSEEEKKYKEEGRLIERGVCLHPYIELTPDEIEDMIKERIKYYERGVREYQEALDNFDKITGRLIEIRTEAKELLDKQPTSVKYVLEKMFKEERQ